MITGGYNRGRQLVIMSLNYNNIVYAQRMPYSPGMHYRVKANTNPIKAHNNQLTHPVVDNTDSSRGSVIKEN